MREIFEHLLRNKGDQYPLGEHFITRFVRHHPQLKSGHSHTLDAKRMSALDPSIMEEFFTEFVQLKSEYNVADQDVYNMDETGFQMGQSYSEYVIFNST
ncbi:hypothetical protein GJ744_003016 [Endocarpon pusillum]|uniref:HTH CENPB-type domain-containing protein n=1 Tax=Endocarpon pusillum TaxID=364733 RepID=A0A8H7E032_9EURO|nr:hypothetical protein GJ744_003016 [Endocarpon pusillum]